MYAQYVKGEESMGWDKMYIVFYSKIREDLVSLKFKTFLVTSVGFTLPTSLCRDTVLSLSTVVLNSRDCQGKLWLPKKMRPEKTTLKQYYHQNLSINVLVQPYKG